ncbi:MAG: 8-oxo-dGTP diphosphatase [Holophagales bacterium]|nr:8-oxo-dGTP diphosphatase [Holophagales bacterium]
MSRACVGLRRLAEIEWSTWVAVDTATLTFVLRGRGDAREVLLIRKKRGLGAGKINGPGGRLEGGESPLECAVREVEEELHVTPTGLDESGELRFQFVDGYSIHVHVFRASGHRGEARETEEAVPLWTPVDATPYDEMWADDRLWLPHLFAGQRFHGRFVFDGDAMLDHSVELKS